MDILIRSMNWRWDREKCILWSDLQFADGKQLSVGVPLSRVIAMFDAFAVEHGLSLPPLVGAVDSVDGFFSAVTKAVKSVSKSVSKAAKATVKATTSALKATVKATASVVRSKYMTYALTAVSTVLPAVGGPALAAQLAAKRALDVYEKAKQAKAQVQAGVRTASNIAAVTRGGNVMQSVRRLASNNSPQARLAVAALRSLPSR